MAGAEEVVERGLQAWARRDVEAFAACYSEDAVLRAPGGTELHGREGAKEFMTSWNEACPDNQIEITSTYVDGNVVIQEGVFHGTHTGNLTAPNGQVIPPTGQKIAGDYADVFKIEGDVVVLEQLYFDQMQLLTQLGLVPAPAAAAG